MALLVYVDDIIIANNNDSAMASLKRYLDNKFKPKDLGPLRFFLGLKIAYSPNGIVISQRPYALQLLQDMGYLGSKSGSTPMEVNLKLKKDEKFILEDPVVYRRLIGRLLYLTITRPDLSYSVNRLSQFLVQPRTSHMPAAQRVLQ
ncbi:hypothetical protein UlMin_024950 [Ulmus minor]